MHMYVYHPFIIDNSTFVFDLDTVTPISSLKNFTLPKAPLFLLYLLSYVLCNQSPLAILIIIPAATNNGQDDC